MLQIINMRLHTLQSIFLQEMREHPNTTAFHLHGEIVTNARFTQYIAPIMNELDAMPIPRIAVLVEQNLHSYAAFPAALFAGKQLVPIKQSWSDAQRQRVLEAAGITSFLNAHRMQYYFRMTFKNALDRIDNGLCIEPTGPIASLYKFDATDVLFHEDFYLNNLPDSTNLITLVCDFCSRF